jgi:hypothetical protein
LQFKSCVSPHLLFQPVGFYQSNHGEAIANNNCIPTELAEPNLSCITPTTTAYYHRQPLRKTEGLLWDDFIFESTENMDRTNTLCFSVHVMYLDNHSGVKPAPCKFHSPSQRLLYSEVSSPVHSTITTTGQLLSWLFHRKKWCGTSMRQVDNLLQNSPVATTSVSTSTSIVSPTSSPVPNIQAGSASDSLVADDLTRLHSLGIMPGINAAANNNKIWIGTDGFLTSTFRNNYTADMILVVWAGDASTMFVGSSQPFITYSLAINSTVTLSIADNVPRGAFSAVYPDTSMNQWGQINNTWGEFTTSGANSTIDISREINMQGKEMKVVTQQTQCVADMDTCAFVCNDGADTCWQAGTYSLINCDNHVNNNYHMGPDAGDVPSGGCQIGNGGEVDVTFL